MKKQQSILVIATFLIFLCFFSVVDAEGLETVLEQLQPESRSTLRLDAGYKLKGSFFVKNETDPGVVFWITDPNGITVVSIPEYTGGIREFEWIAQETGYYTLHFSNCKSSETISLSDNVTGPYFHGIGVDLILAGVGFAILVASSMILVVILERRHRRKSNLFFAT